MAALVRVPIDCAASVRRVERPGAGAVLTFAGTVRDHHQGRRVVGIEYHAYEEMAVQEIERIERGVRERWPSVSVDIVHRLGELAVGEASVFIAVASPHRAEGFEALRFAIDTIKLTVPIWKKELYADGYAWIEGS